MSSQNGYKSDLQFPALYFNLTKFTSTKSKALHFINYQLISRSKTAIGERVTSALERYVCLTTFNEDDCVLTVCVYFQFHSRQFARLLAEEMLSCSSAVMRVALAQSYLTKMSYSL